jgi:methylmalonyl-CoA epimerase
MDLPFRVLGIHHLGLAPKVATATQHFFGSLLGLVIHAPEKVTSQKVICSQVDSQSDAAPIQPLLEILEPLSVESPISKFLSERKGGIHHLALEIDDLHRAVAYLRAKHVTFLSEAPTPGSHGTLVIFVHPKDAGGILVELVQRS